MDNYTSSSASGASIQNQPSTNSSHRNSSPSVSKHRNRTSKALIATSIICAILAIAGVSFGVYGMVSSTSKSYEIADLETHLFEEKHKLTTSPNTTSDSTSSDSTTIADSAATSTNPILSATTPEFYTFTYSSPNYSFPGVPTRYSADIVVRDGDIYRCDLVRDDQHFADACHISGLSGKIYKIVSAGEGQNATDGEIAFILTDGTVQYLNVSDIANTATPSIRGTYDIDGSVVDAVEVGVYQDGQPTGGYSTTLFVLADGSYLPYSSITK